MPSTQYEQQWLEDPSAIRMLIVRVTPKYSATANGVYVDTTLYFSNAPFVSTDATIVCNPIIRGNFTLGEALSSDGGFSMSLGDIELDNPNGELDQYLNTSYWIWSNCSLQIYYGDPTWSTSNAQLTTKFATIFDGVCDDIDSRTRKTLNLKIRDKMERLNSPVTESKLGTYGTWSGGQQNQDTIKPLVFGEVFNITPMLIDPSTLEYMVHDGAIEKIIEIRDNGYPVYTNGGDTSGATVDLSTGKFKLYRPPAGQVTCSVQGTTTSINLTTGNSQTSYSDTIASIIATIVAVYGKSNTRFTGTDLDLTNLNSFNTSNTQPVGYAVIDTSNVLTVCSELARSLGSQLVMTRGGKLRLIQYGTGFVNSDITEINENDIIYNSLTISERLQVIAATKLGYCKNWTVQQNVTTNIPIFNKDSLAEEYLTTTVTDSAVATTHKLTVDPEQKNTHLLVTSDATTEATRLNNFYKTQRTIYKLTGTSKLLGLQLGQTVTLKHSRFSLSNGVSSQVVSINSNWGTSYVDVEVIV